MTPVRVLVVDDSATMRGLITAMLNRDPDIQVVGAAGDPYEARGAIKALNPDVVTLDIEMPNMNGLDFLEKIMRLRPMPVVMVSSQTQAGAEITLRALEIGAVDCVGKGALGAGATAFEDIAHKVKSAARASIRPRIGGPAPAQADPDYRASGDLVVIGASTGGVEALLTVLGAWPSAGPPCVVAQHMPAAFTASFAARLNRASAAKVSVARPGDALVPGRVFLAPGGDSHLEVVGKGAGLACQLVADEPVNGHRPSVDVLMGSAARVAGPRAIGVILTGMGRDGAMGLLAMRRAGARTLGQDEASCVVYGMPRVARELGAVERQLPLSAMGPAILELARFHAAGAR
jgi:two-component system chemotaxis response regulator CheB